MTIAPPATFRQSIVKAIECLLESGARKATVYQHPLLTVVATRRFKPRKHDRTIEIVLTIGRPNFASRRFIKNCIEAGKPFPLKAVQLKFWPEKKTRK